MAIDIGIQRVAERLKGGGWKITVTPPKWSGIIDPGVVILSENEYARYLAWRHDGGLIQQYLSDLPVKKREILLSGVWS